MLFPKNNRSEESKARYKQMLNAYSVGFALIAGVVVGGIMGYYLDKWLGTSPYLLLVFLFFGLIAGIKNAIYYIKNAGIALAPLRSKKDNDENNSTSSNDVLTKSSSNTNKDIYDNNINSNLNNDLNKFGSIDSSNTSKNSNNENVEKNSEKIKKDNPFDRLSNN